MNNYFDLAIKAALLAGEEILRIYNSTEFEVEYKDDNSPLTIADKKAHNIIVNILKKTKIPILSEEGKDIPFKERKEWDNYWLIDPLDGTKEFIKRNGEFTVNIALISDNIPIYGVIYVPLTKDLYFGGTTTGAFKAINVDINSDISFIKQFSFKLPIFQGTKPITVVGSRSHMNDQTKLFINQLEKDSNSKIELISRGSSLKICMVAEGIADIYPRLSPTMEWDIAAGHAIAIGSGCKVMLLSDLKGSVLYNKENLTNPNFIIKRQNIDI